jgi:hypothetical protein
LQTPSEECGGEAKRADCMADIVLAIAKRALAVFPGLAPDDRRECDVKVITWGANL